MSTRQTYIGFSEPNLKDVVSLTSSKKWWSSDWIPKQTLHHESQCQHTYTVLVSDATELLTKELIPAGKLFQLKSVSTFRQTLAKIKKNSKLRWLDRTHNESCFSGSQCPRFDDLWQRPNSEQQASMTRSYSNEEGGGGRGRGRNFSFLELNRSTITDVFPTATCSSSYHQ